MTKLTDFLNTAVSQTAPSVRGAQLGDLFGIEVECEGKNVGLVGLDILDSWAPHHDGSLRAWQGHEPCEWVFNGPANYKRSVERVNALFDYFEKNKARLHLSNRTSIHVHFNMGDKTTYQLVNTYILFTILEDLLDAYCGEDRNGNLFCLSSRHAEGQLRWVEEAIFKNFRFKYNDNWRYCSLNLASLNKFGTIEFRGMRGLDKREDLLAWLDIINELVTYSCYTMKNPVELIESISQKRPSGFIKEVFSRENFIRLTKGIDEDQIDHSIYEGLRLVQMLVYKIGTEFDQVRLRGKDFWAGFQENEPPRDIDPKDILGGKAQKAARPFAGVEMGADPFRHRRGAVRVEPADPGMNPWVVRNADGANPLPPGWGEPDMDMDMPDPVRPPAPPREPEWALREDEWRRQDAERQARLRQQAVQAGQQVRQQAVPVQGGVVADAQNGVRGWGERLNQMAKPKMPKKKLRDFDDIGVDFDDPFADAAEF